MKKCIFVSSLQIFPPLSGGQIRSANLVQAFAGIGWEVEVYSFTGRKIDYLKNRADFSTKVTRNLTERVNMNPLWGVLQYLSYKFKIPPLWITFVLFFYQPRWLRERLRGADIIVADFPFLYPLFKFGVGKRWLNTHNVENVLWRKSPWLASLVLRIELMSLKVTDLILFCSQNDRDFFIPLLDGLSQKSHVLANGVILKNFQAELSSGARIRRNLRVEGGEKIFLFTGSRYAPNHEALQFLLEFAGAHKRELQQRRSVLLIAGSVSDSLIDEPHLKVVGSVEHMHPYFAAADFGLNPVIQGSGVNVKMTEFIAARLPILSTAFGCKGFKLKDGCSALVFERSELMQTIDRALALTDLDRIQMARRAFAQNQGQVDMTKAVQNLVSQLDPGQAV